MNHDFFKKHAQTKNYKRLPINIFMNSLLSGDYTKNRTFSHFDMFPAIIDAIGGQYNAEGLGLGRSMNKNEPTLLEELGAEYINEELARKSSFYNSLWLNTQAGRP